MRIKPWSQYWHDRYERADKRAKKYREELKSARELWGETIHQKNIQLNKQSLNVKKQKEKEIVKVHKRLERLWRGKMTWKYVALIFLAGFIYLVLNEI